MILNVHTLLSKQSDSQDNTKTCKLKQKDAMKICKI